VSPVGIGVQAIQLSPWARGCCRTAPHTPSGTSRFDGMRLFRRALPSGKAVDPEAMIPNLSFLLCERDRVSAYVAHLKPGDSRSVGGTGHLPLEWLPLHRPAGPEGSGLTWPPRPDTLSPRASIFLAALTSALA